jgi:hypothetical protein
MENQRYQMCYVPGSDDIGNLTFDRERCADLIVDR